MAACLLVLAGQATTAQTSQRLSVQGSLLFADIYGDNFFAVEGGYGLELQARYTPGGLSIGGGIQWTHHGDSQAKADGYDGNIELIGVFVEPRYGIYVGSDKIAPYLSARLAFARLDLRNDFNDGDVLTWKSNGVTFNGGGGLLVKLSSRANLDFGATAGFTNYATSTGRTTTNTFDVELGSGTNLVIRAGVALGLGK